MTMPPHTSHNFKTGSNQPSSQPATDPIMEDTRKERNQSTLDSGGRP